MNLLKEIKYGPFSSFEVFIDTISKYVDKIYKDVINGFTKGELVKVNLENDKFFIYGIVSHDFDVLRYNYMEDGLIFLYVDNDENRNIITTKDKFEKTYKDVRL